MQVAQPAPPNLLLRGLRAKLAGAGPQGTDVEEVGVLVLRQKVGSGGTAEYVDPLPTDEPYDAADPTLLRLESDLAMTKPTLDVVAVRGVGQDGTNFGRAEIRRAVAAVVHLNPITFGWQSRKANPRLGRAGVDLATFEGTGENLPHHFQNAFFNGGRATGPVHLRGGDRVVYVGTAAGSTRTVVIPATPSLSVTLDGAPLVPPVSIQAAVDTVVYDRTAQQCLLTWRGVFPWEDRLDLATLEIT